jgi:hypothetical protein
MKMMRHLRLDAFGRAEDARKEITVPFEDALGSSTKQRDIGSTIK